jgi:CDP-diglyceride synthetase
MYPFVLAAAAMTLFLVVTAIRRPRPAGMLAVVLWAAYAVYEYYVANGTLCDANCNIRVDLVLMFPLLGSAAYLALKKEPRPAAVATLYVICLGLAAWVASALGYTALSALAGVATLIALGYGVRSKLPGHRA